MWVICLLFEWIACKNRVICFKNSYFSYVIDSFSPFLCPRANRSRRSLLICSFLKSDLSNFLPSLFTKEPPWAICSGRSWKKSNVTDLLRLLMIKEQQERFALFHEQIALTLTKNKRIARKTDERIPNPVCLLFKYFIDICLFQLIFNFHLYPSVNI